MDYIKQNGFYIVDNQEFINRMHCIAHLLSIGFTYNEADQYTKELVNKITVKG